jgi:pyrimidine-nucleoside phosphorylase
MDALDLIIAKRDGNAHSAEDLAWLVDGISDGSIPDYQISAWLMAVVWRGMTAAETSALTMAMARSGEMLDLSRLREPAVDKHSTGGVGDKTSLVVGPLAAATGLTVAKMSGRGLGHTGGTLDKLESIPGFDSRMSGRRFMEQAEQVGLVIASQSADLAPADKRLYALRDVTGTVPSIPLIAASIMSKKLATGADGIVLDVKVGRGAFMATEAEARQLAEAMVAIGRSAGRRVIAALTRMDQPLGRAIGNSLEVAEAIRTLRGAGPTDLQEISLELCGLLHVVAGHVARPQEVHAELLHAIHSGRALRALRDMVAAQGGDPSFVDHPERLAKAPVIARFEASSSGWVDSLDALAVGELACDLGAGRRTKNDRIDHAVGLMLAAKVGDRVEEGALLAEIHAASEAEAEAARERLGAAYRIVDAAVPRPAPAIIIDRIFGSLPRNEERT